MRRLSIYDVIISIIALAVICMTIVPAVARLQRTPEDARCQSNMRRLARAIQQYADDWDGCYPTNRFNTTMVMSPLVPLSPYDASGQQRFVYGINWVEALYDYIEPAGRRQEPVSVWRCPMATDSVFPSQSTTAAVTYVFNYNLLEQPSAFNRNRAKLMVMREFDRIVESMCRPSNNSTNNIGTSPINPFLTKNDNSLRGITINDKLHGEGSHIMFADGHVSYFGAEYYPLNLTQSGQWDEETSQWWNYLHTNTAVDKAIAITP